MFGSLVLLPLRVGVRAVELGLRAVAEVAERVASLAGSGPAPTSAAPPTAARSAGPDVPARETATPPATVPEPLIVDRGEPVDYDAPEPAEPPHIDVDAELVEEVAEPGAEDGAGAEVRVAEPWDGYGRLRAADVIGHLSAASPEELAAIELYELSGRRRRTVISAVQRELARRRA